jgi:hypothetical protein
LRQHEEEVQRRRDSQERDAAIRNREWVEINLGSVGVVQHVEFADVDVEGGGEGRGIWCKSRAGSRRLCFGFLLVGRKGRFYRVEAVCTLISRDILPTAGGCLESIFCN